MKTHQTKTTTRMIAPLVIALATLAMTQTVSASRYTIDDNVFTDNGWSKPLSGTLTSDTDFNYNSPTYQSNFGFAHGAVDIVSTLDSPVYAIDDGEILRLERNDSTTTNTSTIFVKHTDVNNNDFLVLYGHIQALDGLERGSTVTQGQQIGQVKRYNTPDHLHFSISTDVNDYFIPVWGSIYGSITDPIEFVSNTRNKAADTTTSASTEFDGAASLVNPSETCTGCNNDIAMMQVHSGTNSSVAFQWIYDAEQCSQIDIYANQALSAKVQSKAWSEQDITDAFTVNLSAEQVFSVKPAATNNPWTTTIISSTQPITSNIQLSASCKSQGASFNNAERTAIAATTVDLAEGYRWMGTSSLISSANRTGHGVNKDVVITADNSKSLSTIQWESSSTCSTLTLADYTSPNATMSAQVQLKPWNESNNNYVQKCDTLPCTINDAGLGYFTVKVLTNADAITSGNIQVACE